MRNKLIGMALSTLFTLALVGCTNAEEPLIGDKVTLPSVERPAQEPAQEPNEILDSTAVFTELLEDSAKMVEDENLEGYMKMIGGTEKERAETRESAKLMMEKFDVDIQMEDVKVLEQTDTTAKVQVTAIIKDVNKSSELKDSRTVAVHEFSFVDGQWLFVSEETQSVEVLK